MPDDLRLRTWATLLAEQRRHSLRRDASRASGAALGLERAWAIENELDGLAQLSLFEPLTAVATRTAAVSPWQEPLPEEWSDTPRHVELQLAPPPVLALGESSFEPGATRRETKNALRAANALAARDLARRTGLSHAHVNAELNRLAGVRRITEATVPQLQARLVHADHWLAGA
jgi:hypothetical protein